MYARDVCWRATGRKRRGLSVVGQFGIGGDCLALESVVSHASAGVSLVLGQIVGGFHPSYSLGNLDVHLRR
jgi:hypothetical protein